MYMYRIIARCYYAVVKSISRHTSQRIKKNRQMLSIKHTRTNQLWRNFSYVFLVRKSVLQSGSFLSALKNAMADTKCTCPLPFHHSQR